MSTVLVSTKDLPREQWLEERRKGIGGSDVAAIAGLSRYKSAVQVWLEKTGQVNDDETASESAFWGTVLEDVVAQEFANRTGLKIQRRNAILQHPDYSFMLANLDRIILGKEHGNGVLEVKTASEYFKDDWTEDQVPDAYMLQLQHYLAVTGFTYGYLAVLIGGNKYRQYPIERDEEIIGNLVQIETEFWRMVEQGTPPAFDGSDASTELLKRLYPEGRHEEIELPQDAKELTREYEEANLYEKQWKERKDAAENRLKAMLGEYEVGWIGDRRVEWKTIERAGYSVAPSKYRRFGIK